jgi:hypothetical protein
VSVAPPGKATELNRLDLRGGAVILTWRDEGMPLIGAVPDVRDADTTLRHLQTDVRVAVVTNDQDFLPTGVFAVVADVLADKANHGTSKGNLEVEPWCRSLGETMAETALLLLAALHVPPFA